MQWGFKQKCYMYIWCSGATAGDQERPWELQADQEGLRWASAACGEVWALGLQEQTWQEPQEKRWRRWRRQEKEVKIKIKIKTGKRPLCDSMFNALWFWKSDVYVCTGILTYTLIGIQAVIRQIWWYLPWMVVS